MTTVYVSIGNSDDKLTQDEWSRFVDHVRGYVVSYASIVYGAWLSASDSRWQNACWSLEFDDTACMNSARDGASKLCEWYRQDSIAWAVAETEFIGPARKATQESHAGPSGMAATEGNA